MRNKTCTFCFSLPCCSHSLMHDLTPKGSPSVSLTLFLGLVLPQVTPSKLASCDFLRAFTLATPGIFHQPGSFPLFLLRALLKYHFTSSDLCVQQHPSLHSFIPCSASLLFIVSIFFLHSLCVNFMEAETLPVWFSADSQAPVSVWNKSATT